MHRKKFWASLGRTLLVSLLLLGMIAGCSPDVPEPEGQPSDDVADETDEIEEEVPQMYDQKSIVILHQPGKAASYEERLVASLRTIATQVTVADWNTVTDDAFDAQKTAVLILTGANRVEGTLLEKAEKVRQEQAKAQTAKAACGYTITGEGDESVDALVMARYEAKKAKNFAEADRIRDELKAQGIEVTDVAGGANWKRI